MTPIGQISDQHVIDSMKMQASKDFTPPGNVEIVATRVAPPKISQNFMAPVNDTTNKRCQEWTMEYVRELVRLGYVGPEAIQAVNSGRDPPSHGIGLQPVGAGRGRGA